ncbi:bcl-2-related ovarian killer protein homolog B [Cyprinodon tularosa]|uniref:BCL2 family apoptosis regulator BOK b n=1 Tax=Cyprinodon variegatus TaxID=28743 RepID=A0A3Q2DRF3_CYPVA|nr:PREDICTED: bcl-2-related ovarian killer protein homolog B-like [Cyprinodon variegatus]XP_015227984.1 PREDICTED: bcl-2-related ovarian killer protein homolog B-like [Cyprinodon variegatus]XP_038145283.1 bcl-2-related ovarian killer protein homolog B [Cyprinodon tularosa]XP_038145285.1 bcl-2-related ovarian killer protein homolog B [Cyprinodon tularosa]XP_038145286.1 bcl-2-related ovarian killer protein homolog B [Cyprinodon tularosa]
MDVLRRSSMFASEVLDVFDRSVTEKELVSQSKALCRDYILSRLNQNGLGWSKTELNFSPSNAAVAEVSQVLLCLGDELESIQPTLYRNVARQLNISVAMENVVSDAFLSVATEIFAAGITWGKVVAMYAVAGALAVDCVRQGHPTTVHIIVDSLGQFVRKFLVHWLKRKGGWAEIMKCVVKMDCTPERPWLSSVMDSFKYFLTTVYVYIMKEQ